MGAGKPGAGAVSAGLKSRRPGAVSEEMRFRQKGEGSGSKRADSRKPGAGAVSEEMRFRPPGEGSGSKRADSRKPGAGAVSTETDLRVLYEDRDILVCHKRAGIAVQTGRLGQQDMESLLRNYRSSRGEEPYIGIVHRLDQPVEGVMVFAKNRRAAAELSEQIQGHAVKKRYYALCSSVDLPVSAGRERTALELEEASPVAAAGEGGPGVEKRSAPDAAEKRGSDIAGVGVLPELPMEGTMEDLLGWDSAANRAIVLEQTVFVKDHTAQGRSRMPDGKRAVLSYRILARRERQILFDIDLQTGRRHQIRAQLSGRGCPILGDERYGWIQDREAGGRLLPFSGERSREEGGVLEPKRGIERGVIALCAYQLSFDHPVTGKRMDFSIRPDLEQIRELLEY